MTAILKGVTLNSEHVINMELLVLEITSIICVSDCFCEFDNNEHSVRNRNAHGCGDPPYKYLIANKNVAVETEVEIEIHE
jgi:hypothetical protein